jgi:hypothetical protein
MSASLRHPAFSVTAKLLQPWVKVSCAYSFRRWTAALFRSAEIAEPYLKLGPERQVCKAYSARNQWPKYPLGRVGHPLFTSEHEHLDAGPDEAEPKGSIWNTVSPSAVSSATRYSGQAATGGALGGPAALIEVP